jgi:16S rRNA (adenine1518-N6/adenine1519-N6)-dimethyltransferase
MPYTPIAIIKQYGIVPKKKLGQNFLLDLHLLEKIASLCAVERTAAVLEIGAGIGNLTQMLLAQQSIEKVIAVERDGELARLLKELLEKEHKGRLCVLHEDAMGVDITALSRDNGRPITVTGNLPFNVGTHILLHLLQHASSITRAVLMFQKEVARRITAKPGSKDRSFLSCAVEYHCTARPAFVVKKGAFFPQPEVDAEVVVCDFDRQRPFDVREEKMFFAFVGGLFRMRRKNILNSIAAVAKRKKEDVLGVLAAHKVDSRLRPEDVSLAQFIALFKGVFPARSA